MMSEDKKKFRKNEQKENKNMLEAKTEMANRIADQSQRVASTYQHMEEGLMRGLRWFSTVIDKTLFNQKYTKVIALILACFMYMIVNHNTNASLYTTTLKSSKLLKGVSVSAKYNSDTFELSGLPERADVILIGDASSVTAAANSKGSVIANLEGLTEGTHQVKLVTEGYGDSITTTVDPSSSVITLKKKTTQQFELGYDFINEDKLDLIYSIGVPQFEYQKVNVRASKDTLSSIAFVKALIDVGNQTADFTQEAKLVAYDANGQPVKADIVPATIKVTVPITSPNKTVPVVVEVTGEVPDRKAISAISLDQQTVTVYGSESALSQIDKVVVTLNASTITKDSTVLRPITLPAGINSSNINQVTLNVTLGEGTKKTLHNVKINYKNNFNNYKANQPQNKTTTTVNVYGTEENIEAITEQDVYVYVDMKDAKPGLQQFQLQVDQPEGGLVRYALVESTYTLNVLGEQNDNQTDDRRDSNNG